MPSAEADLLSSTWALPALTCRANEYRRFATPLAALADASATAGETPALHSVVMPDAVMFSRFVGVVMVGAVRGLHVFHRSVRRCSEGERPEKSAGQQSREKSFHNNSYSQSN